MTLRSSWFTPEGHPDLVVTSLNAKPRVLVNSGGKNHWLLVEARGRKLYGHVNPSVGFMSSSDRRIHFGLGRENAIREVEIRWPGGTIQKVTPIMPDRVLRVEEPE